LAVSGWRMGTQRDKPRSARSADPTGDTADAMSSHPYLTGGFPELRGLWTIRSLPR
jgi:hypothetical protein